MMIELHQPIRDLSDKHLNRHIAQASILWLECGTGEKAAETRGHLNDLLDALYAEKERRNR